MKKIPKKKYLILLFTTMFVVTLWQLRNVKNQESSLKINKEDEANFFKKTEKDIDLDLLLKMQTKVQANTTDMMNESTEINPNDKFFPALKLLAAQNLKTVLKNSYSSKACSTDKRTVVDINGDGLADFIYHYYCYGTGYVTDRFYLIKIYLSNGGGFDMTYYCYYDMYNGKYKGNCANSSGISAVSEDKENMTESDIIDPNDKVYNAAQNLRTEKNSTLIDVNGDGLIDLFHHPANAAKIYLNNSNGFDLYYSCTYDNNKKIYKGDCANPNDLL